MRKVKTFVTVMIIMLMSFFATACSCSVEGGEDGTPTEILATDLNISLLKKGDSTISEENYVSNSTASETLNLKCRQGDVFYIQYEITPTDVSNTEVQWYFPQGQSGFVKTYSGNETSRTSSSKEEIKFIVNGVSDSPITLTFATTGMNVRKAVCNIEIGKKVQDLNSITAPTNLHFNPNTSELTWDPIDKVRPAGGGSPVLGDVNSNNVLRGLEGYEIVELDPETKEPKTDVSPIIVDATKTSYKVDAIGEHKSFKVRGITNDLYLNDQISGQYQYSESYTFHKLGTPSNMTNNNGTISIDYSKHTTSLRVFPYTDATQTHIYSPSIDSGANSGTHTFHYTKFTGYSGLDFNITAKAYPCSAQTYEESHATTGLNIEGVNYFASNSTADPLVVKKLENPTITFAKSTISNYIIGGKVFNNIEGSSQVVFEPTNGTPTDPSYGVKYVYTISGGGSTNTGEVSVHENILLDGLSSGNYTIEVSVVGDSSKTIRPNPHDYNSSEFSILSTPDDVQILEDGYIKFTSNNNNSGVELFFVSSSAGKNVVIASQSNVVYYDIRNVGLSAGTYNVYAKIQSDIENAKLVSVLDTLESLQTIAIADNPGNVKVTPDGYIEFTRVSTFTNYMLDIRKGPKGDQLNNVNGDKGAFEVIIDGNNLIIGDVVYKDCKNDSENKYRINLYELIADLDKFTSREQLAISMYTKGGIFNRQAVIGSSGTGDINVFRHNAPDNTEEQNNFGLIDYIFSASYKEGSDFPKSSVTYTLEVDLDGDETTVNDIYVFSKNYRYENGKPVTFDLTNLIAKYPNDESTGETFKELIDSTTTDVKISLYVKGATSSLRDNGYLNSAKTSCVYLRTSVPTNLNVDNDAKLTWETSSTVAKRSFIITFTDRDGNYKDKMTVTATTVADIGKILDNYAGEVIGITVTEHAKTLFDNKASDPIYVTRTATPTGLKTVTSSSDDSGNITYSYFISWDKVPNANSFDITVDTPSGTQVKKSNDPNTFYMIPNTWTTAGEYKFSIRTANSSASQVAVTETTGSSANNPIILASASAEISIYLIDSETEITVDNNTNTLVWDNPTNFLGDDKFNPEFKLEYGSYTETLVFTTVADKLSYDPTKAQDNYFANASTYSVKITPLTASTKEGGYKFDTTRCIFISSDEADEISKYATASNFHTDLGDLKFEIEGKFVKDKYSIVLYDNGNELTLDVDYTITETIETDKLICSVNFAAEFTTGEHKFSVKVFSLDNLTLDSETSVIYTATKIQSVTDLQKVGNTLTWSAYAGVDIYNIYYQVGEGIVSKLIELQVEYNGDNVLTKYPVSENNWSENDSRFVFTKDPKGDAIGYFTLSISETMFDSLTGDVVFTINAITDAEGYLSANGASPLTVTRLYMPTDLSTIVTIDNGLINIADYTAKEGDISTQNPVSYTIRIYKLDENSQVQVYTDVNGETQEIYYEKTEEKFAGIKPINIETIEVVLNDHDSEESKTIVKFNADGRYRIELKYNGDENNILSSISATLDTTKEAVVSQIGTVDGKVYWTPVLTASNYTIEITEGTDTKYYTIDKGETNSLVESDLKQVVEEGETAESFAFVPGTTYTLRLRANKTGALSSSWSETFIVHKLLAPSAITISATQEETTGVVSTKSIVDGVTYVSEKTGNIPMGTPIIKWSNLNTSYLDCTYVLNYLKGTETIHTEDIRITTPSGQIVIVNQEKGSYNIVMKIIGNSTSSMNEVGYITSNDSDLEVIVKFVDNVSTATISEGKLSWEAVEGAYAYRVSMYDIPTYTTSVMVAGNTTEYDISNIAISSGMLYNFTVKALTNPVQAIALDTPFLSPDVYKSNATTDIKILNGQLSWTVTYAEISKFIELKLDLFKGITGQTSVDNIANVIVNYINNRINKNQVINGDLEPVINQWLKFKLILNDNVLNINPTAVTLDKIEDETGKYNLVYTYDVAIDPFKKVSGDIQYSEGEYIMRVASAGNVSDTAAVIDGAYSESITAYKPISPRTWTQEGNDIYYGNVQWDLSTIASSSIPSYKYFTNYNIVAKSEYGDTAETTLNITSSDPYLKDNYRYSVPIKNVGDNNGLFDIKTRDEIATIVDETEEEPTNVMIPDTSYTLYIRSLGTVDSSAPGFTGDKYLNSNYTKVNKIAHVLGKTDEIAVYDNNINWKSNSKASTKTRLFIYGPFDDKDYEVGKGIIIDTNMLNRVENDMALLDTALNNRIATYEGNYLNDIGDGKIITAIGLSSIGTNAELRILELGRNSEAIRINKYTLTEEFLNDESYLPGAYIFKLQEIGDNAGIVDSVHSDPIEAHKLGTAMSSTTDCRDDDPTNIMQGEHWVGIGPQTNVYQWDTKDHVYRIKNIANDYKIGEFVWNPVAGANMYKVEVYHKHVDSDEWTATSYVDYTTETMYVLPSDSSINQPNMQYSLKITAIRTGTLNSTNTPEQGGGYAQNFFYADTVQTVVENEGYERMSPIDGMSISGAGYVSWTWEDKSDYDGHYHNNGVKYTMYRGFRIKLNNSDTDQPSENEIEKDSTNDSRTIALYEENQTGYIFVTIKTLARPNAINVIKVVNETNNEYEKIFLNSAYSNVVRVQRLPNPDVRIQEGVFYWGTQSNLDEGTNTTLKVNNETVDANNKTHYAYYTEIEAYDPDYVAEEESEKFVTDEKDAVEFSVKFNGSEEPTTQTSDHFFVTSPSMKLKATKLPTPVLDSVKHDKESNVTKNYIKWTHDARTSGYIVKAFIGYNNGNSFVETDTNTIRILFDEIKNNTHPLFTYDEETNEINRNITPLTQTAKGSVPDGKNPIVHITVQAIGSAMDEDMMDANIPAERPEVNAEGIYLKTLYLNSSYSNFITIQAPDSAKNLNFENGELSWDYNVRLNYDAKIVMEYTVENLKAEDLDYWKNTANVYEDTTTGATGGSLDTSARESDKTNITRRTVTISTNTKGFVVKAIDTVYLEGTNGTPTSYKVSAIANSYKFSIIMLAVADVNASEGEYASVPVELEAGAFNVYTSGDGTKANPYGISEIDDLEAISLRQDRNFKLLNDIDFAPEGKTPSSWIVLDEFSGVLDGSNPDGGNYAIKNITYTKSTKTLVDSTLTASVKSFIFKVNKDAVIKNIDFTIKEGGLTEDIDVGTTAQFASAVATYNYGNINNVNVVGDVIISVSGEGSTSNSNRAAGIAIFNYYINENSKIENVSFHGDVYCTSNSSLQSMAGGIVTENYGYISYARVIGLSNDDISKITANTVGGIVAENYGNVEKSYLNEFVVIHAMNKTTSNQGTKNIYAGGIAGKLIKDTEVGGLNNPTINGCYSKATFKISKSGDDKQYVVAGIVGSAQVGTTISNCYSLVYVSSDSSIDGKEGSVSLYYIVDSLSPTLTNNYYFAPVQDYTSSGLNIVTNVLSSGKIEKKDSLNDIYLVLDDTIYNNDGTIKTN